MPITPPTSSLSTIQTKVRRLTRSPSTAQLADQDLQDYINTFVIYDFPEHLRTFNLRTTHSFYTNPYQDVYNTDTASFGDVNATPLIANNPLYNFQNLFISVHDPLYIGGYQSVYTQSEQQLFNMYSKIASIQSIGLFGDNVEMKFSGTINTQQQTLPNPSFNQLVGLLQRNVLFSSLDAGLNGLAMVDIPLLDISTGNYSVLGNLYDPYSDNYQNALATPPNVGNYNANNNINYATGAFTVTFSFAPGADQTINSQTVPTSLAIPQTVLYYNNKFTVRPVPDQPYQITFECYQRPDALLASGQNSQLEEYWQLIAYGAAMKIFQDRMDIESVQMIMPEYRNQMNLCNRRNLVQYTNERTATIYTDSTGMNSGNNGWGGFGGNF